MDGTRQWVVDLGSSGFWTEESAEMAGERRWFLRGMADAGSGEEPYASDAGPEEWGWYMEGYRSAADAAKGAPERFPIT